jgi:hypothetical protein
MSEFRDPHIIESRPRPPTVEAIADSVIADYGGDARVAVVELIAIVRHLSEEIRALVAASSPGFARRPPRGGKRK